MKAKILIADDDKEIVKVLTVGLEGTGFEVIVARDAMQTFMYTRQHAPAAILLDIAMPGGSGLDVLKRLKAAPQTMSIPVIIVSGNADVDMPQKVKDMGAAEYIAKPFEFQHVHDIVCKLIGKTS